MKVNPAISGVANILAAINAANGTSITEDQVTVGDPGFLAWETNVPNTSVVLTGVDGKGIEGSRTFNYVRQHVATGAVASDAPLEFFVQPEDDLEASAAKVIAILGLRATEVYGGFYTAPTVGVAGSMNIYTNTNSLLYNGTRSVILKLADGDEAFSEVAPITDLDAFEAED